MREVKISRAGDKLLVAYDDQSVTMTENDFIEAVQGFINGVLSELPLRDCNSSEEANDVPYCFDSNPAYAPLAEDCIVGVGMEAETLALAVFGGKYGFDDNKMITDNNLNEYNPMNYEGTSGADKQEEYTLWEPGDDTHLTSNNKVCVRNNHNKFSTVRIDMCTVGPIEDLVFELDNQLHYGCLAELDNYDLNVVITALTLTIALKDSISADDPLKTIKDITTILYDVVVEVVKPSTKEEEDKVYDTLLQDVECAVHTALTTIVEI